MVVQLRVFATSERSLNRRGPLALVGDFRIQAHPQKKTRQRVASLDADLSSQLGTLAATGRQSAPLALLANPSDAAIFFDDLTHPATQRKRGHACLRYVQ